MRGAKGDTEGADSSEGETNKRRGVHQGVV